jgi:hypothetical protein
MYEPRFPFQLKTQATRRRWREQEKDQCAETESCVEDHRHVEVDPATASLTNAAVVSDDRQQESQLSPNQDTGRSRAGRQNSLVGGRYGEAEEIALKRRPRHDEGRMVCLR